MELEKFFLEDIQLAGKTGYTEQNGQQRDVSCCTLFNIDGSLYTCLIIISNQKEGYPSGGVMAGNITKEIINNLRNK